MGIKLIILPIQISTNPVQFPFKLFSFYISLQKNNLYNIYIYIYIYYIYRRTNHFIAYLHRTLAVRLSDLGSGTAEIGKLLIAILEPLMPSYAHLMAS